MSSERLHAWAPQALAVLRVVVAILFFAHGTQKLLGFPAAPNFTPPEMFDLRWFAGMIELIGGPLLALGLFTRPVAFILAGEMAFAYWISHAPRSLYPVLNNGDAAVLYCFVFLWFVFSGPGAWNLDSKMSRRY